MHNILVVDDEKDICNLVSDILKDEGYKVRVAKDSKEAFALINQLVPTIILLDIWLQESELDGLGILEIMKKNFPNLPIIIMSGHGNISTAVDSIKMGAYDYIEKPFTEERLLILVKRACEIEKLYNENSQLKQNIDNSLKFIAKSSAMAPVNSVINKISPTSSRVLIKGEIGTGKKTVARLIHQKSTRAKSPFIIFSAKGLSHEQINLEFFGSKEELHALANPRKRGMLEIADGGTLFIEELMDLPLQVQNKLLKYLVYNHIELNGSNRKLNLDVRILAASRYNLEEELKFSNFNKDLFYRLNNITLNLPSLNQRKSDIPEICRFYVNQLSKCNFSEEALNIMQMYDWPGNLSELINVIEWLIIVAKGSKTNTILPSMLPPDIRNNTPKIDNPYESTSLINVPLKEAREIFEKQYLHAQLIRFENNIAKTAEFIGMERTALYRKLKSLNLNINENIS